MTLITLLVALSLAAAAACAGMAFTRWGKQRPLHRYGALSIAAHLLLLAGMASVRVGGPASPGAEDAPPVKVRIVMRTTAAPVEDAEPEAKPKAEPEQLPPPDDLPAAGASLPVEPIATELSDSGAAESEPADQGSPPQPPETAEAPPEAAPEPVATEAIVAEAPAKVDEARTESEPQADFPIDWSDLEIATAEPRDVAFSSDHPTTPSTDPVTPTPPVEPVQRTAPPVAVAATPLAPSAYQQRGQVAQRRLSADQGGDDETLDAVAAGVDWLARAQRRDGAWDASSWGAGRETRTLNQDRKGAGRNADTGITGLALLAMGGAGHTHLAGPYRDTVTAGLQYLLDHQLDNGALYGDSTLYARTYCHSMATFALAEAMAVTGDQRLRPAVEAAAGYLVRSQSRATGGWRYQPGDRGDMSQMGWAVMALRSAELAGVAIPEPTWHGCERFIASVRLGSQGGLACYQPRGPSSNTMTAEAMYCRQILGVSRRGSPADREAVERLLTDLPGDRHSVSCPRGKPNLYYWYYATLALHHHSSADRLASDAWSRWNEAMQRAVLPRQAAGGPDAGSWGADTVWGGYGGRVYSTALATMCLEVYYRYDPETIGRDPWLAAREGVIRR